ncbi:MAG: CocE/NonD family hydrolase [Candidatus Handelsmanbacteria bacterium]|nr:CocE/NonD family hydrolase [Candidatus Handelsmanbacteria bacterium]
MAQEQQYSDLIHEKNVEIPMRDGTLLRANITRPKAEGVFPALVERTPYNKEGGAENQVGAPEFFAKRGYAVVIQDVRGMFASDGVFYPFRDDGAGLNRDGHDTVEWMAAQPWCNGEVGMFGGSYSGATQYRAALSRPPHLRALFVRESSADYHREWVYRDGAFELGFSLYWAHAVTSINLAKLAEGEQFARHRRLLDQAKRDMDDWYGRLPLYPCCFLVGLCDWHNTWLAHPEDGPYWWEFNVEKYHDQIETPAYHLGGWYDIFLNGTLKNYLGLKRRARTEKARQNQRLIIGPWVHGAGNIGVSKAGEWDFGPAAGLDFNQLRLPWFDHWLKGKENGVMDEAPVRLFVMGRNEWRSEAAWPLPDTRYTNYYFHSGPSGSIPSLNDGTLSPQPPAGSEHPDSFVYDPDHPIPTLGGNTLGIPDGVRDQRPSDRLCLTYTSAPLDKELEVTGPVKAVLYALSSAPDTDWVVRFEDVDPDGYSRNLCDGILRARYRHSFAQPELLDPGKVYRFEVDLWATSNAFLPGHRLRVVVTSSSFPRFDRNLNTGGPINREAAGQVAINTVMHDMLRPSHLVMPLIERRP